MATLSPLLRLTRTGVLGLVLVGCAQGVPQASTGGFDLLGPHAVSSGLRVRMAAPERRIQTLPATWATASFTLKGANLVADRVETVEKASFSVGVSADSTVTLFRYTRPGSYALYASTFQGSDRTALGYRTPVTLTANSATAVSITLRTLPVWRAATVANAAGTSGDGGAGGPALTTVLGSPRGMAVAPDGTLYVSEYAYNRVRRLTTPHVPAASVVSTVAGSGGEFSGPQALAYSTKSGGLFVGEANQNRIRYISDPAGTPAVAEATDIPTTGRVQALAYYRDAGTGADYLYAALSNNQILEITDPLGDQTFRVVSSSGLNNPRGLAVDATRSRLFVADAGNRRVVSINLSSLAVTPVAGDGQDLSQGDGGLATSASLRAPADLAFEAIGDQRLYILDSVAATVRCVTLDNGLIATVFGTGTSAHAGDGGSAQQASMIAPAGMALYADPATLSLFVSTGSRVRSAAP